MCMLYICIIYICMYIYYICVYIYVYVYIISQKDSPCALTFITHLPMASW